MSTISRILEAHRRRQAIRQLRRLPPHMLRDIGIEPEGIDQAVTQLLRAKRATRSAAPFPLNARAFAGSSWPYAWRR